MTQEWRGTRMSEAKQITRHAATIAEMAAEAMKDKLMLTKTILVIATKAKIALVTIEHANPKMGPELLLANLQNAFHDINNLAEHALLAQVLPGGEGF